jgi:hypothetical protein
LANSISSNSKAYDTIYCIGDINLSRIDEEKGVPTAKMSSDICADNILAALNGNLPTQTLP